VSLGNIGNCPRCGKLYAVNPKGICPTCVAQVDEEYQRCADYLRENKQTNIYILSDETKVTVKQITQFIREGRISIADFPNIGYPCESCGTPISDGRLCKDCRDRLETGFKKALSSHDGENTQGKPGPGYYQVVSKKNNE